MKKILIVIALIAVIAQVASGAGGVSAGKNSHKSHKNPRTMTEIVVFAPRPQSIIESQTKFIGGVPQEPIIRNPFDDIYWDVDDNWYSLGRGGLRKGDTFKIEQSFVADNGGHLFSLRASVTGKKRFQLRFSVPEIGFEYVREYSGYGGFCVFGPWVNLQSNPMVVEIEGSNGGLGVVCTATYEITAIDSFSKATMMAYLLYGCHGQMGICGGTDSSKIIEWNPTWRLVQ